MTMIKDWFLCKQLVNIRNGVELNVCPLPQSGATNCDEDCYDDDDDDSLSDEVDSDDLDDLYDEDEDDEDVEDDDVVQDEVVVRSGRAVARRSTRDATIRHICDTFSTFRIETHYS